MIRIGCRCASRHEPCCVEPRFAWAVAASETGFDELRDLCVEAGDLRSLAIGMVGLVTAHSA